MQYTVQILSVSTLHYSCISKRRYGKRIPYPANRNLHKKKKIIMSPIHHMNNCPILLIDMRRSHADV
jgi:hypothetical protein